MDRLRTPMEAAPHGPVKGTDNALIMLIRVQIMLVRVLMIVLLRALIRSAAHQLPHGPHKQPPLHLRVRAQPICSHATPRHAMQAPAGRQRRARACTATGRASLLRDAGGHVRTYLPT